MKRRKIKMINIKHEYEIKESFTAAWIEITTKIQKEMEEFFRAYGVREESWAGYVRYLIDGLEDKFL